MCTHPKAKVKFHKLTAADRLPGVWECTECNTTFPTDPNNSYPKGIRYLEEPKEDTKASIPLVRSK